MTIEVLSMNDAADERKRLERSLRAQLGTSDRMKLRALHLDGKLTADQIGATERLRSLDYLTRT